MIGYLYGGLGLLIGAVVAGGATWSGMMLREKIVVSGAVRAERDQGVITCNARVGQIEAAHNKAIADAVAEARSAAEQIGAVETDAEIKALCQRSASCRSRGAM